MRQKTEKADGRNRKRWVQKSYPQPAKSLENLGGAAENAAFGILTFSIIYDNIHLCK